MNYKPTIPEADLIQDLPFSEYNRRQFNEISADRTRERAFNAKPAGSFSYGNGKWQPQEYEGFAVLSMLDEHQDNKALSARLVEIQQELHYNLQPIYAFYQLPPESFHQTVANTLSADRFKQHLVDTGLEEVYPEIVAGAFDSIPAEENAAPIKMKMTGLSIFGTAIGILGVFQDEDDYQRITRFRSEFYANPQLAQLGVKMTRPFIGHITLAYIEHLLNKNQKDHLAAVINELNESLSTEKNYFYIAQTGLRRYHHLGEFLKQDNYPTHLL